jgi:probable HAF family extracellular repeat protein
MKRAFVLAATSVAMGSSVFAAPQYVISPLDSSASSDIYVSGINNHGVAVGYIVDGAGVSHAMKWDDTGRHELPYLSSTQASQAYRINDAGQIVGKSAFTASSYHGVMWDGSGANDVGAVGAGGSFANAINDDGVVVGSTYTGAGAAASHAFTWTKSGGMVDYGAPTGPNGNAGFNAISNNGVLAGTQYLLFSPFKAARATLGDTRSLAPMAVGGQFSSGMAMSINESGIIVGWHAPSGSGKPAIFNKDNTVTYLDVASLGMTEGQALDINEDGVIVGKAGGFDDEGNQLGTAFVYMDNTMFDVANLLDPASGQGWSQFFEAAGINDLGQIVGEGVYNGQITGFVMTPVVPEPASLGLLSVAGMLLRRRR